MSKTLKEFCSIVHGLVMFALKDNYQGCLLSSHLPPVILVSMMDDSPFPGVLICGLVRLKNKVMDMAFTS